MERYSAIYRVCKAEFVPALIGKNGANTKRILTAVGNGLRLEGKRETGEFLISALTPEAVKMAAKMLKMDEDALRNGARTIASRPERTLCVEASVIPALIGKNGAGLRQIESAVGDDCYIVVIDGAVHVRANSQRGLDEATRRIQQEERRLLAPKREPEVAKMETKKTKTVVALAAPTKSMPSKNTNRFTVFSFGAEEPAQDAPAEAEDWTTRKMREYWGEPPANSAPWGDVPAEVAPKSYAKVARAEQSSKAAEVAEKPREEFPALGGKVAEVVLMGVWRDTCATAAVNASLPGSVFKESEIIREMRRKEQEEKKRLAEEKKRALIVDLSDLMAEDADAAPEITMKVVAKSFIKNTTLKGNWADREEESDDE